MSRPAWAEIDLNAFQHNLQLVRRTAPSSRIVAVIKANGYGHGIVRAAKALSGADAFGVASIDEAIQLREAGIQNRILLLEGIFEADELDQVKQFDLDLVVHNLTQLDQIKNIDFAISVWLKLDTGMNRLGLSVDKLSDVLNTFIANDNIKKPFVLMTHLANADITNDQATNFQVTNDQIKNFHSAEKNITDIEFVTSIANSAGVLAWPQSHADWIRPGIMLYGVSPFSEKAGKDFSLLPVMTVKSRLINVRHCKKGDAVGYGGTWVCPKDMRVGVVAFGYGDGYPRHAGNGAPVLVNNNRASLIGCVSMDMITVDLDDLDDAKIGDEVELWGKNLPVEEVAAAAGTIAYELVCGITQRVKFSEI